MTCRPKRDPIVKLGSKEKKIWAKSDSRPSRSSVNFGSGSLAIKWSKHNRDMPSSWYRGPDVLQVAERIWRNASRSGISTSNSTTSFALPYNILLVSKDSADKIVIKISMVYTYPIDKSLHILKKVDVLHFIIQKTFLVQYPLFARNP